MGWGFCSAFEMGGLYIKQTTIMKLGRSMYQATMSWRLMTGTAAMVCRAQLPR